MRRMTAELEQAFGRCALSSPEHDRDPVVIVKVFHPSSRDRLSVTAGPPIPPEESPSGRDGDWRSFGDCLSALGPERDEGGSSLLSALEAVRDRFHPGIERDRDFPLAQRRLGEVRSEAARGA